MSFARQVADFCQQTKGHLGKAKGLSASAITWHRDGAITDRMAAPVAMTRGKGPFLLHLDADAFERAQGTLNELTSHGAKPPLHIHMMDA